MDTDRLERIMRDYKKYGVMGADDLNYLIAETERLQAENSDLRKWKDITASNLNHSRKQILEHQAEITRLQGELHIWQKYGAFLQAHSIEIYDEIEEQPE